MVIRKTRRSSASCRAARTPDDRAVIGCAVTALAALLLMLVAGTAKAEQPDFVCYDMDNGELECETFASVQATCELIDYKNELCEVVRSGGAGVRTMLPGNTKYTVVKMTRAGKEIFIRSKPHVN